MILWRRPERNGSRVQQSGFRSALISFAALTVARLRSAKGPSPAVSVHAKGFPTHMRIYFGFTVAGDRSSVTTAARIVELLEELGHEVLTRHLIREDAWQADRSVSPQEVYRRDLNWLQQCDLFVAEVSGSSFGLGFESGYVLGATTKKVSLFYRRDVEKKISLLITGITHPNCTLVPYSDLDAVENWIRYTLLKKPVQPSG